MYEYNKVIESVANFIDAEILSKTSSWQKWVIGSGQESALSDTQQLFEKIKDDLYKERF